MNHLLLLAGLCLLSAGASAHQDASAPDVPAVAGPQAEAAAPGARDGELAGPLQSDGGTAGEAVAPAAQASPEPESSNGGQLPVETDPSAPVEAPAREVPVQDVLAPLDAMAPAPSAPAARVGGTFRLLGSLDTRFDSFANEPLPENVAELRGRGGLDVDVELAPSMKLHVAPRVFYRAVTQRGGTRAKATWELLPSEAWLDLYGARVDVRLGYQVVTFGANPLLSPADVLNPRDLRQWLLVSEPDDFKLPNLAARAVADVAGLQVTAAWFPFFQPHLYDVVGQDQGLHDVDVPLPQRLDPSVEDRLQPYLLTTQRPPDVPFPGDLGLRATRKLGAVTLGGSWSWTVEKLPQVTLDPELARVFADRAAGRQPSGAALLSLQQRFEDGQVLWTGRHARNQVVAAEVSALVGSSQLDVDVGFSPAQTFVDDRFRPVRKAAWTAVVGLGQADPDSDLLYAVSWLGMAVPGVGADELLLVLEPGTARGAARTAWNMGVLGTVAYRALDRRLEVGLRAVVETRGVGISPRVSWQANDRVTLLLAAEIYDGRSWSLFGLLGRNDQVIAGVQLSL